MSIRVCGKCKTVIATFGHVCTNYASISNYHCSCGYIGVTKEHPCVYQNTNNEEDKILILLEDIKDLLTKLVNK